MLFGNQSSQEPDAGPSLEQAVPIEQTQPRSSTFRTVCVRACDGFFFPVSYTTRSNAFERDEAICKMTCPGTQASLFAYPNPGGAIEQAVSPTGQLYKETPNAFRYRTEFVSGCSCRPEGMSWAEALSGIDDRTLRKGDIIVDEARSQARLRYSAVFRSNSAFCLAAVSRSRCAAAAPPPALSEAS
jgi:hypothetical protein